MHHSNWDSFRIMFTVSDHPTLHYTHYIFGQTTAYHCSLVEGVPVSHWIHSPSQSIETYRCWWLNVFLSKICSVLLLEMCTFDVRLISLLYRSRMWPISLVFFPIVQKIILFVLKIIFHFPSIYIVFSLNDGSVKKNDCSL